MLCELTAEAKEVRMELGPLTQGVGEFLADDVLCFLPFSGPPRANLDRNEALQRAVEVDVGRHRDVEETLSFAKVQVGPRTLPGRLQNALVVGCNAVEHPVDSGAIGAAALVGAPEGRVDRHCRADIPQAGLRRGARVGVKAEQLKLVQPVGGGVGHSARQESQTAGGVSSKSSTKLGIGKRRCLPSASVSR